MGRPVYRVYRVGGRKKKLLMAFLFIQGGQDPESLCEKVNGECTGKSTLEWRVSDDEKTNVCPVALLRGAGHLHTFWKRTKQFGQPKYKDRGWFSMPNRWQTILGLLEDESQREYNAD